MVVTVVEVVVSDIGSGEDPTAGAAVGGSAECMLPEWREERPRRSQRAVASAGSSA